MQAGSYKSFVRAITDLKPAVKNTIKPILDKCKSKTSCEDENDMEVDVPTPKTVKQVKQKAPETSRP